MGSGLKHSKLHGTFEFKTKGIVQRKCSEFVVIPIVMNFYDAVSPENNKQMT